MKQVIDVYAVKVLAHHKKAGTDVELDKGSVLIECRPTGSVKNWGKNGYIYRVENTE